MRTTSRGKPMRRFEWRLLELLLLSLLDWRFFVNGALQDSGNIGNGDVWSRLDPRTFGVLTRFAVGDIVKLEFERTHVFGTIAGVNLTITMPAPCPADLNGDDVVNVLDLIVMLGAWGPNPGDPAELNGDNTVNVLDLILLLGAWGVC